jgi:GxxExxY protein
MLLKQLSHETIGAFYDVYNALGYGFLESTYQRAMLVALAERGISVRTEVPISVHYRGVNVGDFRLDLVVSNTIIVECKTAQSILPVHRAQLLHYLRATTYPLGLLLNFGPDAKLHRFIQTQRRLNPHDTHSKNPMVP